MIRSDLDPFDRARLHPIVSDKPAVRFFEGALLGNGGLGAVVMVRPDAVAIALGHNNVWDIRVSERNATAIGTFADVFERVRDISDELTSLDEDPWFRAYCETLAQDYRAPYPRPFPCGMLILGFDRRRVEALGYRLDVATGVCDVWLDADGERVTVEVFVEPDADRLWLRSVDQSGRPIRAPFNRLRLLPDRATSPLVWSSAGSERQTEPAELPLPTVPDSQPLDGLTFSQTLPVTAPVPGAPTVDHPADRAVRVTVRLNAGFGTRSRPGPLGVPRPMDTLEREIESSEPFVSCLQLDEGLASVILDEPGKVPDPVLAGYALAMDRSRRAWQDFWACSGVALDDELLERIWYRNLYFFSCAVRPGVTCPGLFANWSYGAIGTAWHGDYHMNYNTQQPFWVTFSSNHVDKHLPYVDLVDRVLPLAQHWASDYYGLRGACFPHSAYPVATRVPPYPVPTWGWEICETPWTVQSLWWHYIYTMDEEFLRARAFPPIREAVDFLVHYLHRSEAHGPHWGDECYHVFPTVVPELYGLSPGFAHNHDCLADLTLTRFLFNAYLRACAVLDVGATEGSLPGDVRAILTQLPPYPTAESRHGRVFTSVAGEDPEIVYNVPVATMTVFPGEEHGIGCDPDSYAIAANTYYQQQNEGGNDLVFLNMQGARLGLLDLERFKRQIRYCLLPNGTCADMVLQVHGRYHDETPFDFMAPMGIWFENFALPAVINECLLQSHGGVLRLFPNWPLERRAKFRTLRAVGAFLVSAACGDGAVKWIEVTSEVGAVLRLANPWSGTVRCVRDATEQTLSGDVLVLATAAGESVRLSSATSG